MPMMTGNPNQSAFGWLARRGNPRLDPARYGVATDPDELEQKQRSADLAESEDEYDRHLRHLEGWSKANQPGAPSGQWSASPMEHVTGTLGSAWDALKQAAHWAPLAPAAKKFSDWVTTPELEDSAVVSIPTPFGTVRVLKSHLKGFLGGAAEGLAEQVNPMNVALTVSGMKGAGAGLHALGRGANLVMAGMGAEDIGRGIANEEGLSPADQIARIGGGAFALGMGGAFGAKPAPFRPSTAAERASDALAGIATRSEAMAPNVIPPKPEGWTPGSRAAAPPRVQQAPTVPPPAAPPAAPGAAPAEPALPRSFSELSAAMTDALARNDTEALARLNIAASRLDKARTAQGRNAEVAFDQGPTLADMGGTAISQTTGPVTTASPVLDVRAPSPVAVGRSTRPTFDQGHQPGLRFNPDEPTAFEALEAQARGPMPPPVRERCPHMPASRGSR